MADDSRDNARMGAEMYAHWERAMTAWWDRVLGSPEVLKGMNAQLSSQVEARAAMQRHGTRWLERMNLPTRDDLTRLLRVLTLLEERVLSMEDRVLELNDALAEARKDALRARIASAETRMSLEDELASLKGRLAELEGA